jgi:16S rRNA (adenine1518-N6/adenine1519-N6)-dimethyltransferase
MSLMFQKEVAQRIVAPVNSDAYGRLAVIAGALARCEIVMDLPARAFTPPPKVASAVARLDPYAQRPSDDEITALEAVTREAFGQRRKMLKSSLKALGGAVLCQAAGIDPEARAETIDVDGFLALARTLES